MMQPYVIILFPEMHQNSPIAIKDLKFFSRRKILGLPLWCLGKGRLIVNYRNTLRSSVQKRLNQSRFRLCMELGGAQGIMC